MKKSELVFCFHFKQEPFEMMSQQITKYSIVMANSGEYYCYYLFIYIYVNEFRHPGKFAVKKDPDTSKKRYACSCTYKQEEK